MELQHTHSTTPFSSKYFPIIVVCDSLQSPANIGGLFRITEAFGVKEVIFYNSNIDFDSSRLKRTSRETHKIVDFSVTDDIISTLEVFRNNNYDIVALEISEFSLPSEEIKIENKGIVLIIGNEQSGISEAILAITSKHMHIEMYGTKSSMNVVQATAIALYTLTNKLKCFIE
jgi:tRNA G18 (ribose-2'-O)-methylase SpoU